MKVESTPASRGARKNAPPVISLVNLGCAKNLVDSERILGNLAENGFLIAQDPAVAEVCLVNTCGFINDAREETASVLNELSALKETGSLKALVALGCLVERVADAPELNRFLKAADVRLGFKEYPRIVQICQDLIDEARGKDSGKRAADVKRSGPTESAAKKKVPASYNDFLVHPRLRIGSPHTAFLKIAEGCNNPCTFCAIPRMRGLLTSRPIEKIVDEAKALADGGALEISLIAQDTTSYGQDFYGKKRLADLLRALQKVKGPRWFRLMYAYPKYLDAEMLDVLASDERFCPYIDMPLQHISDPMLSAMARGVTKQQTIDLMELIKQKLPNGAVRSTFIVGYPGESERDTEEMVEFVQQGRFTHAGVFLYSTEPLTPASKLPETVPLKEKKARRDAVMLAQREISRQITRARVGSTVEVLIDGTLEAGPEGAEKARAMGRTKLEAPEVDGAVYVIGKNAAKLEAGTFVKAKVIDALDYDIVVKI